MMIDDYLDKIFNPRPLTPEQEAMIANPDWKYLQVLNTLIGIASLWVELFNLEHKGDMTKARVMEEMNAKIAPMIVPLLILEEIELAKQENRPACPAKVIREVFYGK